MRIHYQGLLALPLLVMLFSLQFVGTFKPILLHLQIGPVSLILTSH